MFTDEIGEALNGFCFGNIELYCSLTDVEIDLVRSATYVAEIRIGHFTGTVDDATHHGDAYAFEMTGGRADFLCGALEVEERATTAWAGDVVGFKNTGAGGLEDVISQAQRLTGCRFTTDEYGVADTVAEQRSDHLRCAKKRGDKICFAGWRM